MIIPTSRQVFFLAGGICVGLLSFSLFLQHVKDLDPCPLCISQRVAILILGIVALSAAGHNPGCLGFRIYSFLVSLFGAVGVALAARQIWIQHIPPDEVPSCMPDIGYLVDILPFAELVEIMLTGTGGCAEVQWMFLGLSIPSWTFLVFIGFVVIGLFEFIRNKY